MSANTEHYDLVKPEYGEPVDIEVVNGNMDIIDEELYKRPQSGQPAVFSTLEVEGEVKFDSGGFKLSGNGTEIVYNPEDGYLYIIVNSGDGKLERWRIGKPEGTMYHSEKFADGVDWSSWSERFLPLDRQTTAGGQVWAGPAGGSGSAGFRKLVASDIPDISASKIKGGTLKLDSSTKISGLKVNANDINAGTLSAERLGANSFSAIEKCYDVAATISDRRYVGNNIPFQSIKVSTDYNKVSSFGNTGWTWVSYDGFGGGPVVHLWGMISANVAMTQTGAGTNYHRTAKDYWMQLPFSLRAIRSIQFGWGMGGSVAMGVTASTSGYDGGTGDSSAWWRNPVSVWPAQGGQIMGIPFRFISLAGSQTGTVYIPVDIWGN